MRATWHGLRGRWGAGDDEWGIRTEGGDPKAGDPVVVHRKDGAKARVVLGERLWEKLVDVDGDKVVVRIFKVASQQDIDAERPEPTKKSKAKRIDVKPPKVEDEPEDRESKPTVIRPRFGTRTRS